MRIKNIFEMEIVDGRHFMVCLDSSIFCGMIELNETAAFIVDCLKTDMSITELSKKLSTAYEVDEQAAIEGIEQIILQLKEICAIEE